MTVDNFGKFDKSIAESMASRFGFQSVKNAEKFIMNLRVHRALSNEMDCCLRGGLCTPFYATDPKAKRVSIDLYCRAKVFGQASSRRRFATQIGAAPLLTDKSSWA